MATLTGKKPSESYKDLLQVSNTNAGIDTVERSVEDGEGTSSIVKLSTTSVDIDNSGSNTFKLAGSTITSTATEINYTDGVTSNIQTQLDSKSPKLSTTQDSFIVGGASANSTVNKTASEVRTQLGMGTGYAFDIGADSGDLVQHGSTGSSNGIAQLYNGKVVTKTASATRTDLGLSSSSSVSFGSLSLSSTFTTGDIGLRLLSTPLSATSANAGKVFYYSDSNGTTSYRYLAMIIATGGATYAEHKIITKSWTTGSN